MDSIWKPVIDSISYQDFNILFIPIVLLLGYVAAIIIYRLTFHPLAKYPGPFLAKITDAYSVYYALSGRRHINIVRLHRRYGDIVRFGPSEISINTNTALKDLYSTKANVQKSRFYSVFPGANNIFNIIDKKFHAQKKRILSQAFSEQALRGLQPYMLDEINTFCDSLMTLNDDSDGNWSSPKNIARWTNFLSYDVLGSICYGKSFRMLSENSNRFIVDLINGLTKTNYAVGQWPSLTRLGLTNPIFTGQLSAIIRFIKYSDSLVKERRENGAKRRDFFYYLLDAKDPETGAGLGKSGLEEQSRGFLIAGADTTSLAFSSCFYYLLHNPAALSKLTSEIRSKFTNVEDIKNGPELISCLCLHACIDESLRLSPPVPTGPPREVLAGGITIDNLQFPKGVVLSVPTYAIQRDEKYFADPEAFKPDRWIASSSDSEEVKGSKAEAIALARSAYFPFSLGPRKCLGQRMSLMQISSALARVVWLYDMRLAGNQKTELREKHDPRCPPLSNVSSKVEPEYPIIDYLIALKDGPMVQFKPRGV